MEGEKGGCCDVLCLGGPIISDDLRCVSNSDGRTGDRLCAIGCVTMQIGITQPRAHIAAHHVRRCP